MADQGSVRAARERLSQMQAIRQQKRFEEYQKSMFGGSPTDGSSYISPNIDHSSRQQDQEQPQWPLAAALAPRHIVTAAMNGSAAGPDRPGAASQVSPSRSTKRAFQQSSGNSKHSAPAKPERMGSLTRSNSKSASKKTSQSSLSSLGPIPDFPIANKSSAASVPVKTAPVPAKSIPVPAKSNLRPQVVTLTQPYYTQFAVVSPITEERSSAASIRSYASSHVIPQRAGDFFEEAFSDEESVPRTLYKSADSPKVYLEPKTFGKPMQPIIAIDARSKPLPVPIEVVQEMDRPALHRLPSSQYEPNKTSRHARGTDADKSSEAGSSLRRVPPSMLGDRVGAKRPPNLEFEKPRSQEARSSLTSLPDLIWRATRVRANLDRGKTASRLGAEWAIADRNKALADKKRQQMLMPSPGPSIPTTDWPSGQSGKEDFPTYQNRRARWSRKTLMALVILFILLVALAIIIPVVTVVVPRQQAKAAAASNAATCVRAVYCANGGLATQMPGGLCACTCVDGFSGAACELKSDSTCASTSVNGSDTTMGASVLPLIKVANGYNVPLDAKLLANEFQKAGMTCANENALITLPVLGLATASSGSAGRDQAASTISGIVVAGSPTPTVTSSGSTTAAAAAQITALPLSIGPGANSSAQEFAKIGILFVLQDSRALDAAVRAQQSLAAFMDASARNGTSRAAAAEVGLGGGYVINLWDFAVKVRNGTVYGRRS